LIFMPISTPLVLESRMAVVGGSTGQWLVIGEQAAA
jgi:hypothetical protein